MKQSTDTLPPILLSKLAAIQGLCRKYKVKHLWVFGSVVTNEFSAVADRLLNE